MLVLHMFALCYGSGFQTMGTFPFIGVHKRNCDRGSCGRISRGKRNTEIVKILCSDAMNGISVSRFDI